VHRAVSAIAGLLVFTQMLYQCIARIQPVAHFFSLFDSKLILTMLLHVLMMMQMPRWS